MKLRDKKYPSKQMVNLAVYDKSVKGSRHMAPVLFLYLLFIVVFIRFFLLEPVKEMAESEAALSQKQEELLRCQEYNLKGRGYQGEGYQERRACRGI